VAISLAVPHDDKYLAAIEALIGNPIPQVDAPWQPKGETRGPAADSAADTPSEKPSRGRRGRGGRSGGDDGQTRSRSDDGQGRSRGDGAKATGMGEHLPSFIALSFDERRGGPARSDEAETDQPDSDTGTETDQTGATDTAA
jgi:hypothetical protein